MAIGVNFLDALHVFNQINQNLMGLQYDMRRNAQTWKALAQAESQPAASIAVNLRSAGNAYLARLSWIQTIRDNPTYRQRILDILAKLDIPEQDIIDKAQNLNTVATQIAGAAPITYAQIITVCDQIIAAVEARFNLWPE